MTTVAVRVCFAWWLWPAFYLALAMIELGLLPSDPERVTALAHSLASRAVRLRVDVKAALREF